MPTIRVKENEPFEVALRRFKRTVEKTGLLTELRAREFYEKPTAERKRKHAAAVKRHHKRLRSQILGGKCPEQRAALRRSNGEWRSVIHRFVFSGPLYCRQDTRFRPPNQGVTG